MIAAQILTAWTVVQIADQDHNFPQVAADLPLAFWTDVTAQAITGPGNEPFVVQAILTEAQYQALLDHPAYGPGAVLWSNQL